jgi:aspartoacylase
MKICVVVAQHGDELFGLKVLGGLVRANQNNILNIVGNPEAIAKRKRFIDTDLNRSFNSDMRSREVELAKIIRTEIEKFNPDFLLDIHTSKTDIGKVAIVAEYSETIEQMAQLMSMETIVVMPKNIASESLIGCFPDKSISVELGIGLRSDELADKLVKNILDLNIEKLILKKNLPRYIVTKHIPKGIKELNGIVNLKLNKELNGYPFLASPTSYDSIGGFLAEKAN